MAARRLRRVTDKWKISVIPSKSTAVVFSRRRKRPPKLRIDRTYIPSSKEVKYLGLHLQQRVSWRSHTGYLVKRLRDRRSSLMPLLSAHYMTRWLGKLLVGTYVVPMVTYAFPVWGYLPKTRKKKLESLPTRGLRWAVKALPRPLTISNRDLRQALGVRSLNSLIKHLARKFYRRASRFSDNSLISDLGQRIPMPGDSWQTPASIIH